MNLGFDLDEVVVDLMESTVVHINKEYGIDWTLDKFTEYDWSEIKFHNEDVINDEIVRELRELVNDPNFQYKALPTYGACEALAKMKRAGHRLHFISSRPKQNQSQTYKWLRKYSIPFDSVNVIGGLEKGVYARKLDLDMYVDDHIKHLSSMLSYKKRWKKGLLLFDKPWNSTYDASKFTKVGSWQEILRLVGVQNR